MPCLSFLESRHQLALFCLHLSNAPSLLLKSHPFPLQLLQVVALTALDLAAPDPHQLLPGCPFLLPDPFPPFSVLPLDHLSNGPTCTLLRLAPLSERPRLLSTLLSHQPCGLLNLPSGRLLPLADLLPLQLLQSLLRHLSVCSHSLLVVVKLLHCQDALGLSACLCDLSGHFGFFCMEQLDPVLKRPLVSLHRLPGGLGS